MPSLLSRVNTPPAIHAPAPAAKPVEPPTEARIVAEPPKAAIPPVKEKFAAPPVVESIGKTKLPPPRKTQREADLINGSKKSSRVVDFIHNRLKHVSTDTGVPFSILVNRSLNEYLVRSEGKKPPAVPNPY